MLLPGPRGSVHHFTAICVLLVSKLSARPAECVSKCFTLDGTSGNAAVSTRWKKESVGSGLPIRVSVLASVNVNELSFCANKLLVNMERKQISKQETILVIVRGN